MKASVWVSSRVFSRSGSARRGPRRRSASSRAGLLAAAAANAIALFLVDDA
jgi:hypothetical protein